MMSTLLLFLHWTSDRFWLYPPLPVLSRWSSNTATRFNRQSPGKSSLLSDFLFLQTLSRFTRGSETDSCWSTSWSVWQATDVIYLEVDNSSWILGCRSVFSVNELSVLHTSCWFSFPRILLTVEDRIFLPCFPSYTWNLPRQKKGWQIM